MSWSAKDPAEVSLKVTETAIARTRDKLEKLGKEAKIAAGHVRSAVLMLELLGDELMNGRLAIEGDYLDDWLEEA